MRIAVVAPSSRFERGGRRARRRRSPRGDIPEVELYFHPQCFLTHNHFAGTDAERAAALVEVANDPGFGAIWFARGGYGACRVAEAALAAPRAGGAPQGLARL